MNLVGAELLSNRQFTPPWCLGFLNLLPEALQLRIGPMDVIFILDVLEFHQRGYSQLYWVAYTSRRRGENA